MGSDAINRFLHLRRARKTKQDPPASLGDLFRRGYSSTERAQAFRRGGVRIITQYREAGQEQAPCQRRPQQPDPDQPNVSSFCR